MQGRWPVLLALAGQVGSPPRSPGDSLESKGKAVPQERAPLTQFAGLRTSVPLGSEIRLGEARFAVSAGSDPKVSLADGRAATTRVRSDKAYVFKWREERETRETSLRFRRDVQGDWHVHNAETIRHSLAGSSLRLVDCNVNGDFDETGVDGYCVGASDTVLPLQERFLLEDRVVEIESLSADGVRLSARVEPVEGSPQQLAALARINRLRSASGLPGVELDQGLSAACTAHAEYLELHAWSGLTNPHDQTLGTEGASAEGREAARRSNIILAPPADSIADFWNTYYHRIPLMSPVLARVGVNARPEHIAVVDVAGAFEQSPEQPWPWNQPISVPSPGAVGVPTTARSELPDEPVPDLGSRGCPLILLFPRGHPPLTSFSGTLRRLERGEAHELPVLVGNQGLYTFAYGLVPEQPLKAGSEHEAIFSFTVGGESRELVVPFRTE